MAAWLGVVSAENTARLSSKNVPSFLSALRFGVSAVISCGMRLSTTATTTVSRLAPSAGGVPGGLPEESGLVLSPQAQSIKAAKGSSPCFKNGLSMVAYFG